MSEELPFGTGVDEDGNPVPVPEEDPAVREIESMVDFYQTMRAVQLQTCCSEIQNFCKLFESINEGCGCSRKNRIKHVENLYVGMTNLTEETKTLIKEALGVDKVQLFHEAGLFSEF